MVSNRFTALFVAVGVLLGVQFLISTLHSIDDAKQASYAAFLADVEAEKAETSAVAPKSFIGPRNVYPISLKYKPTLSRLRIDGQYEYVNDRINSFIFDLNDGVYHTANLRFVHYNYRMPWNDLIRSLTQDGLRPAKLEELMIFRVNYPNETFTMPIVAMGSMIYHPYGWWAMPYIQYVHGDACLDLTHGDHYDPNTMVAALPIEL